jgi:hypothetical protein
MRYRRCALVSLYLSKGCIFEPEPLCKILKAVGWGAIPAIVIALFINTLSLRILPEIFVAVLTAPIVEEACKGIYIYKMRKEPELEGPMDGLVYGAAVAIGFEIVENILYSFSTEFGLELSAIRSIAVGHILFTGLFGLMVGLAKIKTNKSLILYGYAGAVLMHLTWNGLVSVHWVSYFVLVPVFIFILKKLSDVAWKYELDASISPREDIENKARRFVSEHGGASTADPADELGIEPHRTALFMKSAGAKFDRERKKWLLVAPEPERRVTSEPKIKCTRCGAENAPGSVFCTNCGNKLIEEEEKEKKEVQKEVLYCTNCGVKLKPDSVFCTECGKKVR